MPDTGRRVPRLRQRFPLRWTLGEHRLSGSGEIYDLSVNGLCFQIDREFPIPRDTRYLFTLEARDIPALPRHAFLRWFRQPQRSRGAVVIGFQCGATFKLDDPQVARAWTDWITAQLAAAQAPR